MKTRKRILSAILALSMTSSMFSAFAVNAYAETIYAEESEAISDEIKNSGEFYVATPNINMTEGSDEKDILGRTYEYCLTRFAEQEGKNAGLGQAISGGASESYISKNFSKKSHSDKIIQKFV